MKERDVAQPGSAPVRLVARRRSCAVASGCKLLAASWKLGTGSHLASCTWRLVTVSDGTERSPVAHLNGVQGVAGSKPAVPTKQYNELARSSSSLLMFSA